MPEETANTRLEIFCDAVFAISLTLLILELKTPAAETIHNSDDLWHSLKDLLPSVFAFLLSFTIIATQWVNHHEAMSAPDNSEFNLWFEYDLFCQVNMWFVLSLLNSLAIKKKVFAVYTSYLDRSNKQFWNGFGPANASELRVCFTYRISLTDVDLQFGQELWKAYKNGDLDALIGLSKNQSPAFPYLQEVVVAHVDRFPQDGAKGRPEKVLEDITKNISTDFHQVFKEFWSRESIYGFGDIQLKRLYDKVMNDH